MTKPNPTEMITKLAETIPAGSIPAPWIPAFDAVLSALQARAKGNAGVQAVIDSVTAIIHPEQTQQKETNNANPTN